MSDPFKPSPPSANSGPNWSSGTAKLIYSALVVLVVFVCVVIIANAVSEGGEDSTLPIYNGSGSGVTVSSDMRTAAGDSFYQSIARNIRNRDSGSLRIACDGAKARLAKSRDNDEIYDWLDLIDSCNAGLAGDWAKAQTSLP